MAAIASTAAAELQKANPKLYPKAPHAWGPVLPEELHAPLLCAVCHERIQPEEDIRVHLALCTHMSFQLALQNNRKWM